MPPTSPPGPLIVAAAASAAAGIVHAAAAGSHAGLPVLAAMFGGVAVLQIVWAGAALLRGGTAIVLAGVGLHLAALGTWLASRTVGIAFVDGLDVAQDVGTQDGLVATLQVVAVTTALVSLTSFRPGRIAARLVPVLATTMLVAAVPAAAIPHDAGHGGAHDEGHPHVEATEVVATPPRPLTAANADPAPPAPAPATHVDPPGAPAHGHG